MYTKIDGKYYKMFKGYKKKSEASNVANQARSFFGSVKLREWKGKHYVCVRSPR